MFIYDGDGKRVKSVMNMSNGSTTTYFVGGHYEIANGVVTKYYYAGSQRIALRQNGTLNYVLGDHLGSTSLVVDAVGVIVSETRYKVWGEVRYSNGVLPTKHTYTGQYSYTGDFGLMFYQARWYDPSLSRFAQADTIVPESTQGVQAWDRYAYANNSPVVHVDPSGHNVPICFACTLWQSVSDWWSGRSDGYNGPNGANFLLSHPVRRAQAAFQGFDRNATSIWGLMRRAFYHETSANITGQALDKVKTDPALLREQSEILAGIKNDPRYGVEAFTSGDKPPITSLQFGEHGSFLGDGLYEETWMLRAANLKTSYSVNKQGDISLTHEVFDTLDLRPDWGGETRTGFRGFAYNAITTVLGTVWHDYMGASDEMRTYATWATEFSRQNQQPRRR
jgi:RHS repeat-associated protein